MRTSEEFKEECEGIAKKNIAILKEVKRIVYKYATRDRPKEYSKWGDLKKERYEIDIIYSFNLSLYELALLLRSNGAHKEFYDYIVKRNKHDIGVVSIYDIEELIKKEECYYKERSSSATFMRCVKIDINTLD